MDQLTPKVTKPIDDARLYILRSVHTTPTLMDVERLIARLDQAEQTVAELTELIQLAMPVLETVVDESTTLWNQSYETLERINGGEPRQI